jgi:hypothetical protein
MKYVITDISKQTMEKIMKTYYASGEGYQTLVNEAGNKIGFCPLKRPLFSIERNNIEEAMAADINEWSFEEDSGGNYEFNEGVDPGEMDFWTDELIITEIFYDTIEEY